MQTRKNATRLQRHALAWCTALMLWGCQTPPPPPSPPVGLSAAQQQVLRGEGFQEADGVWTLLAPSKLLFEVDTDKMNPAQEQYLLKLGRTLQAAGLDSARVEGHTDDTGGAQYNLELSTRRAQRVAEILVRAGLDKDKVITKGWGSSRPLPMVAGEQARRENRRVAIIVPGP